MEKLTGVLLASVWKTLQFDKNGEIIRSVARYQDTWMSTTLKQYGTIYYAEDLSKRPDQTLCSYVDKDGTEMTRLQTSTIFS
jgi:hypothetical protein